MSELVLYAQAHVMLKQDHVFVYGASNQLQVSHAFLFHQCHKGFAAFKPDQTVCTMRLRQR